jgi:esterase/lipase
MSVREYILSRIGGPTEVVELSSSGHVVTNDDERERVAAETVRWLTER